MELAWPSDHILTRGQIFVSAYWKIYILMLEPGGRYVSYDAAPQWLEVGQPWFRSIACSVFGSPCLHGPHNPFGLHDCRRFTIGSP
jgi:hypothetical protein